MSGVNKNLPALGLAIALFFGTLAGSQAQVSPTFGPRKSLNLSSVLKNYLAEIDRYTLSVGMDSETAGLSSSASTESRTQRVVYLHDIEPRRVSLFNLPYSSKVSLQLLDLVLLL